MPNSHRPKKSKHVSAHEEASSIQEDTENIRSGATYRGTSTMGKRSQISTLASRLMGLVHKDDLKGAASELGSGLSEAWKDVRTGFSKAYTRIKKPGAQGESQEPEA